MKINWDKLKTQAVQATSRAAPAAKVIERVVTLAARLQTVTPMGAVGMAAAGINAAHEHLRERTIGYGCEFRPWVGPDVLIPAMQAAGARIVRATRLQDGVSVHHSMELAGESFLVDALGAIDCAPKTPEFRAWLIGALDAALPSTVRIAIGGRGEVQCEAPPLAQHDTEMGAWIASQTRPFLSEGARTILLYGAPGVGKTTMAQEVARRLGLGRVAIVPNTFVGYSNEDDGRTSTRGTPQPPARASSNMDGLALLGPRVVIVDDVDKVSVQLAQLEAFREVAPLTILTANNAESDVVLDAAAIRPGRIDEVYKIVGERSERSAPFDQLDSETWDLVKAWPVAALNELAARIRHRGPEVKGLRLGELKERIERRTRSRGELL